MPKISLLPVGVATSSTPFPAIVGGVTDQVTLSPLYSVISTIQTDVSGKAATVHTHAESDVTNLVSDLASKSSTGHTHTESDVTNLVSDLSNLTSSLATVLIAPTAGNYVSVSGGNTYGIIQSVIPPLSSTWTWVNQDSASVTVFAGRDVFKTGTVAGTHMFVHVAPTNSATARILPNMVGGGLLGICFRESGTGKIIAIFINSNKTLQVNKYTNTDTFASSPITSGSLIYFPMPIFLRLLNAATISFQYSVDGAEYVTLFSEAKATFFTVGPDQVGYFSDSGTTNANMTVESWVEA